MCFFLILLLFEDTNTFYFETLLARGIGELSVLWNEKKACFLCLNAITFPFHVSIHEFLFHQSMNCFGFSVRHMQLLRKLIQPTTHGLLGFVLERVLL